MISLQVTDVIQWRYDSIDWKGKNKRRMMIENAMRISISERLLFYVVKRKNDVENIRL